MNGHPSAPAGKTWKAGTLTYTLGGLVVLFLWLLGGDFAWTIKQRAVDPVAQLLMKRNGAADMLIGMLVGSLPNALGMLLGPVVGMWSDRHRGHWGRRIPFLLIPTPFAALAMVGVAFSPAIGRHLDGFFGASSPGPQACALIAFSVAWLVFEALTTISNTVFGALINDVVPAEMLGRFFGMFRAVGLLAGIVFNVFLMGKAETYSIEIFIGLAAIYAAGFTMMCLKVKEGSYPEPPPPPPHPWAGVTMYLRECYGSRYYLRVFLALALAGLALGPVNSFSVLYAKQLGVSMQMYGYYQAIFFACSIVLAYGLGSLADRFHPLRVSIGAMAVYGIVMFFGGFLITDQKSFGIFFVLHGVLSGIYFTASASLGQRLFPKARFAQFASAAGIMGGIFFIIMPTALGAFLDWSGHEYRHTFTLAAIIAAVAVAALWNVHGYFLKLGGPKNYVPPEA
jgi:MFS family permease